MYGSIWSHSRSSASPCYPQHSHRRQNKNKHSCDRFLLRLRGSRIKFDHMTNTASKLVIFEGTANALNKILAAGGWDPAQVYKIRRGNWAAKLYAGTVRSLLEAGALIDEHGRLYVTATGCNALRAWEQARTHAVQIREERKAAGLCEECGEHKAYVCKASHGMGRSCGWFVADKDGGIKYGPLPAWAVKS